MNFEENFEIGVQGDEEKTLPENPGEKTEKKRSELTPEEYEKYKEIGQKMVTNHDRFFKTFAKDVSLKFKLSDAFYIDFDRGEVHMDTKWFAERGFTKDQIVWANLHELSHFIDFSEDPEAMLENFNHIREEAKQTSEILMKKIEETFSQTNPELVDIIRKAEQPPQTTDQEQKPEEKKRIPMSPLQKAAYKMHHTFYNILDDIYVNNVVARKAPKYEAGRAGGNEIKRLYKEELFSESDYSKLPRHLQFIYTLLRKEMIRDEEVTITDEIKEIFERKITFKSKEYTVKEIIEKLIKPRAGRDTNPNHRYGIIKKTLEPIFKELLNKDIEEWDPKGYAQEGSEMNPFEGDYKQYDDANPDQFSDEEIEKWVNKNEEEKKEEEERKKKQQEEAKKSPNEKAKAAQEEMDKKWAEENQISPETMQKFREIEASVEPYLQELSELWRHIVLGSSPVIERGKEGYFKTGELDIAKVIEEYPKIERKELDDVRVMKRTVSKEGLIQKPELIRARVIGDMSGSVAESESKKRILQQAFVLILSSLQEFNTYLNMNRQRTKSKLQVDSEAWAFGSRAQKIKKLRSESGIADEQVEIVKIFEGLVNDLGSTKDDIPLTEIYTSLSEEDKQKIAQEKILEFVLEITDGGSDDVVASRSAVTSLDEIGVLVKAFQIGQVRPRETENFNYVWNDNRTEKLGEVVGTKVENLLPALTSALKKYLGNVRL
jgi:hypothetical protein